MLQIRKKAESVFKHFNEQGDFMLSRGYFKLDNGVFQIVENGGARRFLYALSDITVYDDTASGTAETFATDIELYERLVALRYNLLDTASGGFVSDLTSYPIDFPFVGSNTFVLPNNYVVVSVHVNIALQKKVTYSKTGNNLRIIGSLETGDVVEVRGVIALGSFSGGGGGGGASTFLDLTDTPSTYVGQAGKYPKVNAGETGLEFDTVAGGGGTWGSITGTISDQTDLQAVLDLKAPKNNPTFTGSVVVPNAVNSNEPIALGQYVAVVQSTSFVDVYSSNKLLTPADNQDTIFMDSGTLTINPSTQTYQDGYAVAVKSSGVANTSLVLTAATDWTYQINDATALASGSVFIEKGGTCTIIKKATLKIFSIDGSII